MCTRGAVKTTQLALKRCRSSVVEHSLGKGEAVSSILTGSTILSLTGRRPSAGLALVPGCMRPDCLRRCKLQASSSSNTIVLLVCHLCADGLRAGPVQQEVGVRKPPC